MFVKGYTLGHVPSLVKKLPIQHNIKYVCACFYGGVFERQVAVRDEKCYTTVFRDGVQPTNYADIPLKPYYKTLSYEEVNTNR